MAIVFWKDSLDFDKIILNKEQIEVQEEKKVEGPKNKGIFLRS